MKPLQIHPGAQLKSLPAIEWLVDGVVPMGAMVTLFSNPGLGKSFIALDMCLSIAAGKPWLDRFETAQGDTLYLPFEGLAGLGQRIVAWETLHGVEETPPGFWYSRDMETIQNPEPMQRLMEAINITLQNKPKLVVIDTLSRAMLGAEENSARDANLALAHLDQLRAATGTAILLIHHTSKNTDYERGSTAIRGACDTMLLLKKDDDALILKVDKQRDADPGDPLRLFMTPVADSVAFTLESQRKDGELTHEQIILLKIFRSIQQGFDPVSGTAWRDQCEANGIPPTSFRGRLAGLVKQGVVERVGSHNRPTYIVKD